MRPTIILDTETTSLTPDYTTGAGVIWELAMIERDCGAERVWRMQPNRRMADEKALAVGRYDERTEGMRHATTMEASFSGIFDVTTGPQFWSSPAELAPHVAGLLQGATLVAANPAFDTGFLSAFLAANGCEPTWHYRLRDIGSMAYGWLVGRNIHEYAEQTGRFPLPPIDASTDEFAKALGVDPGQFDRHTALGDCRLVAAMLDVIGGGAL